jgi:hypothetical protein
VQTSEGGDGSRADGLGIDKIRVNDVNVNADACVPSDCTDAPTGVPFCSPMSIRGSSTQTIRALLLLCCSLLAGTDSFAKLVARRDFRDGVLDAELVVIVLQQSPDTFLVEEVFLGNIGNGDSIEVPGFRLFTEQRYGPDIVEPITSNTRILLFLHHKKDAPAGWEPTYFGNCFFWVQDPQQTNQLRSSAEQAVALRRQWEKAASTSDPRRRAEALWPFLSIKEYGPSFLEHTKAALQSIAPVSGDYFADQFVSMARSDRADLFKDAGAYGGEKLHETLTSYIKTQQQLYETFVSTSGLDGQDVLTRWNTLPEYVKDVYGDIYYGLAGLASFQRRDDLPLIRDIARWAVQFPLEQTCEAALDAFRRMPDENNLPVISLIWKKFPLGRGNGDEIFHIDVIRTLCTHKYEATVPLLAPFVSDGFAGAEVQAALSEIVGRDLGNRPQPWLDWYETKYNSPHHGQNPN